MGVGACSYRQQQRRGQPAWPPLSRGPRRDAQQRCRRSSRARRLGATPPAPVSCTHTQAQAHTQVSQQRGTRVGRGHRSLARAHTLVRGSAARRLKNPRHGGETNRGRLGQRACARTWERGGSACEIVVAVGPGLAAAVCAGTQRSDKDSDGPIPAVAKSAPKAAMARTRMASSLWVRPGTCSCSRTRFSEKPTGAP